MPLKLPDNWFSTCKATVGKPDFRIQYLILFAHESDTELKMPNARTVQETEIGKIKGFVSQVIIL